jgi:hypothetical protein
MQMRDKLLQLDGQVHSIAQALLEGAGPGGPYERTLLLVAGDHGQTLQARVDACARACAHARARVCGSGGEGPAIMGARSS